MHCPGRGSDQKYPLINTNADPVASDPGADDAPGLRCVERINPRLCGAGRRLECVGISVSHLDAELVEWT